MGPPEVFPQKLTTCIANFDLLKHSYTLATISHFLFSFWLQFIIQLYSFRFIRFHLPQRVYFEGINVRGFH